ncbi:hypothetical protein [Clostridium sp. VAP52]|uniref:hypothetical protein n=1 Tax=Clostridium sp. VAP52 TaxID=2949977 RepID=UPI00207A00A7|nr:hypothetical protein [Clostridium sp. VAP52]
MEELEEKIENEIRNKVFIGCFSVKNEEKGKKILKRLYLQFYHTLNNIETKRLILYNLIYAERRTTNDEIIIQKWVRELKNDMDKVPNYKYEKTGDYCSMLSYYCDCKLDISKEKLLQYYNFCYVYYKESYENEKTIENYIYMNNMNFNINKILKNFKKVLNVVKDLHNIENISLKAKVVLEQIIEDIKILDNSLYKEAINIIENMSTNVDCI